MEQPRDGEWWAAQKNRAESSNGLDDLQVARALWILREDAAPLAIDAATRALLEGHDGDFLRELAGERRDISPFELGPMIDAAITSAGHTLEELTWEQALHMSAVHYAKQVLAGNLGVRELARWAHAKIGHEGPTWGAALVDLDDQFDAFDLMGGRRAREPEWRQLLSELLSTPLPPRRAG